jgi:hypothetical protein
LTPYIPTSKEVLIYGRTDVFVGSLLVAWLERFDPQNIVEVNIEVLDPGLGATEKRHLLYTADAKKCLAAIRAYLPAGVPLRILPRPGTERRWQDAHPEEGGAN